MLLLFFSMSLSGSLLLLILLLIRPFLGNRVSRKWQYYIFLVIIARLLLPFAPEQNLMGMVFGQMERGLFQSGEALGSANLQTGEPAAGQDRAVQGMNSQEGISGSAGERSQKALDTKGEGMAAPGLNLWLIWAVVALLLFIRKLTIYQSFAGFIKAGRREVADPALLDRLAQAQRALGIKRPLELYTNGLISSALLIGFVHPCIVLPTEDLPEADFYYTVYHELIHYRRRDMWYKWLVQATICLHWFNPLVYRMERETARACELACDEAVMEGLSAGERRAYGDTLLRAMGAGGNYANSLAGVTLNESAELLKERLGAIMYFKKKSKKAGICAALLTVAFLAGASATGVYAAADRQSVSGGMAISDALKGDADTFRYTQEGYYQPPYLFEIGWNVRESAGQEYAKAEISLPDGSVMELFYTDACDIIWEDDAVRKALGTVLGRLRERTAGSGFPMTAPLVISLQEVEAQEPAVLAGQYYQEGSLPQFSAVFAELTEKEQRAVLDEIYGEEEIAFFGAAAGRLEQGSPLIGEFAGRAYGDERISFFSILTDRMDQESLQVWLGRAQEDKKASFSAVLFDAAGKGQEKAAMEEELERQRAAAYEAQGIVREGDAWFYRGERVKSLLDTRPDSSVVTFENDPRGTVRIHIRRSEDGKITSVGYMTKEEEAELFGPEGDDPQPESPQEPEAQADAGTDPEADLETGTRTGEGLPVRRMKVEELPENVSEGMENCAIRTWYLLRDEGKQYLYYNGFAWEFAWEPVRSEESWQIRIEKVSRKSSGYVLISLPDQAPVEVTVNAKRVLPEKIEL